MNTDPRDRLSLFTIWTRRGSRQEGGVQTYPPRAWESASNEAAFDVYRGMVGCP